MVVVDDVFCFPAGGRGRLGVNLPLAAVPDGVPAELIRCDKILGGVVGHVETHLVRDAKCGADGLISGRAGFTGVSGEFIRQDNGIECVFQPQRPKLVSLHPRCAIAENSQAKSPPQLLQQFSNTRERMDVRGMKPIDLD